MRSAGFLSLNPPATASKNLCKVVTVEWLDLNPCWMLGTGRCSVRVGKITLSRILMPGLGGRMWTHLPACPVWGVRWWWRSSRWRVWSLSAGRCWRWSWGSLDLSLLDVSGAVLRSCLVQGLLRPLLSLLLSLFGQWLLDQSLAWDSFSGLW